MALVLSGDSDLVPPVKTVRERWPAKRVIVLFPPDRKSDALRRAANGRKWISEADLRQSQLPGVVQLADGKSAARPAEWV